ncbi:MULTISPECIES: hypothetical protein [unclassified Pseudomonas]|uniref:hypothetical protein n=1 Tax=unclassified Pseudomonas TaxID=196821 RepID=UPI00131F7BDC|nr:MULTISPECIES: hypothetical protein [unclassified Pseudomonas]NWA83457.1 hypothetical protein [Pseudomonas sp. D2002]QHD08726.1 hypothetical protein PspR76_24710 [Pseudomonas sp. R76]
MSITALAAAIPLVGALAPLAGQAMNAVTQLAKTVGDLANSQSQRGGQIANADTHSNHHAMNYSQPNAGSKSVNVNIS